MVPNAISLQIWLLDIAKIDIFWSNSVCNSWRGTCRRQHRFLHMSCVEVWRRVCWEAFFGLDLRTVEFMAAFLLFWGLCLVSQTTCSLSCPGLPKSADINRQPGDLEYAVAHQYTPVHTSTHTLYIQHTCRSLRPRQAWSGEQNKGFVLVLRALSHHFLFAPPIAVSCSWSL